MPGKRLIVSSVVDLSLISILAVQGVLMQALAIGVVGGILAAAIAFALLLDIVKITLFRRLNIA
jgi:H+-transporting ATPase